LEGRILAAARTSTKSRADQTGIPGAPTRTSFAKIREPLEVPNLLALQTDSFDWLIGNEAWQQRAATGQDASVESGLAEILGEISPIEDFSGSMSLSFSNPRFEDVKASIEECKDKDMTYAAPLFVTAEFTNNTTGEIKSQTVFMGDFPMMTRKGTFVINGTERVVVSQLVRSPGVYFDRSIDKTSDVDVFGVKIIPGRGAWLEFDVDKRQTVGVRIDRKRRQPVTVLLKALGWTPDRIREHFSWSETLLATLEKDHIGTQDEALLDIYRKLRPGEPPTRESAQALLENLFFNPKRYDLAKVGRYKANKKLGTDTPIGHGTLTEDDIVKTIEYLIRLHAGEEGYEVDDIDHFGNRRLRTVGELIQNQVRVGLSRMERVVRERMTTQDVEAITPQTLINIRPVVASIKEFFGTSQLSQFMDQTNPLAGLTHKRRLSALGPGGLSRDRAGMEVRDVHPSHYGRMCPIETPEGPNIGLIGSLASFGRVNSFGFVETPYRKVDNGRVTDRIDYLTADEEDRHVIAQANATIDARGHFAESRVLVRRKGGEVDLVEPAAVDYMDVSPRQMVSVATAMIPFLEHDDANRALMGANMQRQAVPLLRSESPLVGTGMELRAAVDAADVVSADKPGVVEELSADYITVMADDGTRQTYRLAKFARSNQGTSYNQKPIVAEGDRVEAGQVIADGPSTDHGEMALGKNLLVAFMPWEGHNYEDAIILNQRLVQDDVLTSIHIEEHEVDARDTKLGAEEITRDIPNVSEEVLADLDDRGIVRVGADVNTGDVLVGKVTPKGETELTPEERLLRAIFGEKAREVRDTSLKVPHGEAGKVIGVRVFSREDGDELAPGVNELVRVYIAQKRKIQDGDKLAGRHGNKGVIAKILPPGGHAVPRGRLAGGHRAQSARCAEPDEHRPGARDAPGLGGQQRLADRGRPELGGPAACRGPRGPTGNPHLHARLRRRARGRDHRPAQGDQPDSRRPAPDRLDGQGPAARRPLRRAVPGTGQCRLRLHPQAAAPGGRQDPRPIHRAVLDDHSAAAGRQGTVRWPAVRRDGVLGDAGLRRGLRTAGAVDHQVRRHPRPGQGVRGHRQGREHPGAGHPGVVQGAAEGAPVALPERRGAFQRWCRGRDA
jgi:DNA-directed RNA polymerase subunit beta